jgi:IS1 family transposase
VAGSVRDRKHRWEQENRQREIEHDEFRRKRTEALVMAVLADDLPLAEDVVEEMLVSDAFAAQRSVLEEVQRVTDAAGKIDDRIMASFSAQRGDTIDLELSQGVRRLKVGMVIGDNVQCYQELDVGRSGASLLMVGVDDLSTRERLARMGPDSLPEVALAKGIMAFRARAYTHAETYFGLTNPFLAKHLLARLQGGEGLLAD